MEIIKTISIFCVAFILAGCAGSTYTPSVNNSTPQDDATVKLAEAAAAISQSLTDLNAIEKASKPPINDKVLAYPTSSDMNQLASIDWSGPIEPLLQRISGMCDYKLRVIGTRPPIPVLVTLSARNTPIGYLIRDADFQAASKAKIEVYPGIHVIELRYAKS
jgi:defect-in-organelle-trafficking protein DotD